VHQSKRTYSAPFVKLCKEVFHARAEANNILKYLRPLVSWFEGLENESRFENLVEHFTPIVQYMMNVIPTSLKSDTRQYCSRSPSRCRDCTHKKVVEEATASRIDSIEASLKELVLTMNATMAAANKSSEATLS